MKNEGEEIVILWLKLRDEKEERGIGYLDKKMREKNGVCVWIFR